MGELLFLAAGEGFEPSHTESESAVLPLHNPAKRKSYYTHYFDFVKFIFLFFQNNSMVRRPCLGKAAEMW